MNTNKQMIVFVYFLPVVSVCLNQTSEQKVGVLNRHDHTTGHEKVSYSDEALVFGCLLFRCSLYVSCLQFFFCFLISPFFTSQDLETRWRKQLKKKWKA